MRLFLLIVCFSSPSSFFTKKEEALFYCNRHRLRTLHASLKNHPHNDNDHAMLFIYLYDAFTDLYGQSFADNMIAEENKRSNPKNNYKDMWDTALALTREQRQEQLKETVRKYR